MQHLSDLSTSELIAIARNYYDSIPEAGLYTELMKELTTRLCANTTAVTQALKERDALKGENSVMLSLLTSLSENHVEYYSDGECGMFAGVPLDYLSAINSYVSRDVNAESPFAATDAAIAERNDEIEFLRKRIKEIDLIFGKNLLAMQCAIIEAEHGEGHKAGLLWIFNTLFGPGEFAPDEETDAQAYFNREAAVIDKELDEVYGWFRERHERIEAKGASHE